MKLYNFEPHLSFVFRFYIAFACFGYCLAAALSDLIFPNTDVGYFTNLYRLIILLTSLYYLYVNFFVRHRLNLSGIGQYAFCFLLLFWFVYTLRFLFDGLFQLDSLNDDTLTSYFITGYIFVLVPLLSMARPYTSRDLLDIFTFGFYILLFGVSIALIVSAYQILSEESLWGVRFATERMNPISLGRYSALLFMFGYALHQLKKGFGPLLYFAMFIGVLGVMLSGSRGALVASLAVVLIGLGSRIQLKSFVTLFLVIPITIYATLFILSVIMPQFNLIENYLSMGTSADKSAQIRFQLYDGALTQFYDSPIIGDLILERVHKYYPHNHFLEVLMATGIIGFLVYLALNSLILLKLIELKRSEFPKELLSTLRNIFIFYLVSGMFSGALIGSEGYWFLLVIICFTLSEKKSFKQSVPNAESN